jgi:hybrid cluster-associated redox disulfide protein
MITKDSLIGEALRKKPELAELFLKKGLHCAGCPMMSMETIEQGCKAHGMSDKDVDKLIKELNKKVDIKIKKSFK